MLRLSATETQRYLAARCVLIVAPVLDGVKLSRGTISLDHCSAGFLMRCGIVLIFSMHLLSAEGTSAVMRKRTKVKSPSRVYRLYHVTPIENHNSIVQNGLLLSFALNTSRPAVWLVSKSRLSWAIKHTLRRHRASGVSIYVVTVPRGWLTRAWRGVWRSGVDVPPLRLRLHAKYYAGVNVG